MDRRMREVANAADSYPLHRDIACGEAIGKVDLQFRFLGAVFHALCQS